MPWSGSFSVEQATTKTDWSYGLPPGVRPDLLRSPLGQHGAMAGTGWEQRGRAATSFFRLVMVEFRKLLGTLSDRVLLALAPIVLVLATYFSATSSVGGASPTAAAYQNIGLLLAVHVGQVPVYVVVLKTFSGEWHYRSIQLSLLLQPRRFRYGAAQIVPVFSLWLIMAIAQFGLYLPMKSQDLAATPYQNFVAERPWWMFGIALLASFVNLLFVMCIAFLLSNPTAAVVTYFLLMGAYLFRFMNPPVLRYFDPWQPASLLAGNVTERGPTIVASVLLIATALVGFWMLSRRDAR